MIKITEYGKGETAGVKVQIAKGTSGGMVIFGVASLIESIMSIDKDITFEEIMADVKNIIERDKNNESSSPKDSPRKN